MRRRTFGMLYVRTVRISARLRLNMRNTKDEYYLTAIVVLGMFAFVYFAFEALKIWSR
jgi:hypothetical protein